MAAIIPAPYLGPEVNVLGGFPGLESLELSTAVVASNLTFSLVALFLLLVAATMVNTTVKENAAEIEGYLAAGARPFAAIVASGAASSARTAFSGLRLPGTTRTAIVLTATAAIYAVIDPSFGLNEPSAILFASLIAVLALTTFLYEGGQVLFSRHALGLPASIRVYPAALGIALVAVILTRTTEIHPGVIFGFVASAAIIARNPEEEAKQGIIVFVSLVALLAVAVVALVLISPLRDLHSDGKAGWWTLPETVAVGVFVGGAQSTLLTLIPLKFNDGEKLWTWNRLAWFAVALPTMFVVFQVILNRDQAYGSVLQSAAVETLFKLCILSLGAAVALWLYFKVRARA